MIITNRAASAVLFYFSPYIAGMIQTDIASLYRKYLKHPVVQTDTRNLQPGALFFALKGPNFNGNLFAKQALDTGAAYVIADEATGLTDERIIHTDNVLSTLQALAFHHRKQLNIPVIAITGSNGKTTTKELVHAVLATQYKTSTTVGNLNNHIGVPLTLLKIKPEHEIAVVEMGANHQKEIEHYCSYTLPTHGIITNCGKAHLEGFGGIEGVRKGKGELFDFLRYNRGVVFAFDDYDYLHQMSIGIENIQWYGRFKGIITGSVMQSEPFVHLQLTGGVSFKFLQTQLVGDYNLPNLLCAIAIAKYFEVPDEKIKQAIENYIPGNSRSQLIIKGSNNIVLDAYNANPTSMKAAIENFAAMHAPNKVLLLGGMMELGAESVKEHQELIHTLQQYKWVGVYLVGGDFAHTTHDYHYVDHSTALAEQLRQRQFSNTFFLVKGSRSKKMELALEGL